MTDRIDDAFAVLEQVESPLTWTDVTTIDADELEGSQLIDTEPPPLRRPAWHLVSAAAVVLFLLAAGVWLVAGSSDSSSNQDAVVGPNQIRVGVATLVMPDGMSLDGSVTTDADAKTVRAQLSTTVGMCTITSDGGQARLSWLRSRNNAAVQHFNVRLEGYVDLRRTFETRVAQLDQQLSTLPSGSTEAASIISLRDAARQQIDLVDQQLTALTQAGPERPRAGEGFTPIDSNPTTWRAQATPTDVVAVTCPDRATAERLVNAILLPGSTLPDPATTAGLGDDATPTTTRATP